MLPCWGARTRGPSCRRCATLSPSSRSGSTSRGSKSRTTTGCQLSSGTTALNPLRCSHISTAEITACLEPIWETNNPTAERLRGYIEDLLDYAVDALDQERKGPNPARAAVVHPRLPEVKHVTKHLRAMPYEEVPAFMAELGLHEGYDARALEFIILSAVRSSVITGKDDGEKDNKVAKDPLLWDHMKEAERVTRPPSPDARKGQFPIPLTDALVLLLQRVKHGRHRSCCFPRRQERRVQLPEGV